MNFDKGVKTIQLGNNNLSTSHSETIGYPYIKEQIWIFTSHQTQKLI